MSIGMLVSLAVSVGCAESAPAETAPSTAARIAEEGRNALTKGNIVGAQAAFERAQTAGRNEVHGRVGMAAVALAQGDVEGAKKQLTALRTVGLDPSMAAPYLVAVLDGLTLVGGTTRLAANATPVAAQPSGNRERPAPRPAKAESASVERLRRLIDNGRAREVIVVLEPLKAPDPAEMRLLADAYYQAQRWKDAVTTYRHLLAQEPGDEELTQYLADGLFRLKRYDDAIRFYRVLAEAHPEKPGFWKQIGDVAQAKGDVEVALGAYQKARANGFEDAGMDASIRRLEATLDDPEGP